MVTTDQVKQEIIDWYSAKYGSDEDREYESFERAWEEFREYLYGNGIDLPSGRAKLVADFGGEGQGEELWVVFSLGDQLFRVDGYYASWDGSNWDGAEPYEVEPVPVVVTQYNRK